MKKEISSIYLEDLVANAFIELADTDVKSIPLSVLEEYGERVSAELKERGYVLVINLSRALTWAFQANHKKYFSLDYDASIVRINDNISIDELIIRYRSYLPLKVMVMFMDEKIVKDMLLDKLVCPEPSEKNKEYIRKIMHKDI